MTDPFTTARNDIAGLPGHGMSADVQVAEQRVGECAFVDCPPGLFRWNGLVCFKSEYSSKPGQQDAYCVDSGEYFWGGTSGDLEKRRALLVTPLATPKPADPTSVAGERDSVDERDPAMACLSSLRAAISLLEKGGKKAAASDRMFEQMLRDYRKAAENLAHALTINPPKGKADDVVDRMQKALAPFAAVADEWDRWQRKGSTSTPRMIQLSYGRCTIGLEQYQAAREALATNAPDAAITHDERVEYEERILAAEMETERLKRALAQQSDEPSWENPDGPHAA